MSTTFLKTMPGATATTTYVKTLLAAVVIAACCSIDTTADEDETNDRRAKVGAQIIKRFDTNGDGKLSETEKAAARKAIRDRRGSREGKGERGKLGADTIGEWKSKIGSSKAAQKKQECRPLVLHESWPGYVTAGYDGKDDHLVIENVPKPGTELSLFCNYQRRQTTGGGRPVLHRAQSGGSVG